MQRNRQNKTRTLITCFTAGATLIAAGCSSDDDSGTTEVSSEAVDDPTGETGEATRITVDTDTLAFSLDVPEGMAIGTMRHDPRGTDGGIVAMSFAGGESLQIEAVPADCEVDNEEPLNGDHGTYRRIDDVVPAPENVDDVETGLGTAQLFSQDYRECTNECTDYTEAVAIVTLDEPRADRYATLVIRSDKGELDEDVLAAIVASLGRPT